jgi:hypothetical protein
LVQAKKWKRDTSFGTWNVSSLYRPGSLTTVVSELVGYKLDFVGVEEVRWDKEGTVRAGDNTFVCAKGNESYQLRTEFFLHQRIVSAVKIVYVVS